MIWIVMPILIVLMFLLGTDLNKKSFTDVARNPRAVMIGMLGQLVLLPLIAFGLAWALNLPPVQVAAHPTYSPCWQKATWLCL